MTFLAPMALWLLAGVAALAVAYLLTQRRNTKYAVRFTNLDLLDVVAPQRPGIRRHLPAVLFLGALSSMVVGLARPAREAEVPKEQATIIVAIDTSLSMLSEDVSPRRIDAAKAAASAFVAGLPDQLNVGLVDFNGVVRVRVSPTTDHAQVIEEIEDLELDQGTAIGDAIIASVDELNDMSEDGVQDGKAVRIILMSDGTTTVGSPDSEGIAAAIEAKIEVSTIAFGTDSGVVDIGDQEPIPVPVDRPALQAIADQTGGSFFTAETLDELRAVYDDIGSAIGFEVELAEVTWWFVALAMGLLTAAGLLSMLWFSRLP